MLPLVDRLRIEHSTNCDNCVIASAKNMLCLVQILSMEFRIAPFRQCPAVYNNPNSERKIEWPRVITFNDFVVLNAATLVAISSTTSANNYVWKLTTFLESSASNRNLRFNSCSAAAQFSKLHLSSSESRFFISTTCSSTKLRYSSRQNILLEWTV